MNLYSHLYNSFTNFDKYPIQGNSIIVLFIVLASFSSVTANNTLSPTGNNFIVPLTQNNTFSLAIKWKKAGFRNHRVLCPSLYVLTSPIELVDLILTKFGVKTQVRQFNNSMMEAQAIQLSEILDLLNLGSLNAAHK
jgi:hypothetical protein